VTRGAEDSCKKVSIVSHSKGSPFSLIALNEFPTTASERVQTLVNHTPCFIPDKDLIIAESTADDDDTDDGHSHSYHNNYYYGSWDREAYHQEFKTLYYELSYSEYRAFYKEYRKWEQKNYYDWYKNENWKAGI